MIKFIITTNRVESHDNTKITFGLLNEKKGKNETENVLIIFHVWKNSNKMVKLCMNINDTFCMKSTDTII